MYIYAKYKFKSLILVYICISKFEIYRNFSFYFSKYSYLIYKYTNVNYNIVWLCKY